MTPTPEQLDALLALCEATPPGPWRGELDVFDSSEGIEATLDNPQPGLRPIWLSTASTDQPTTPEGWEKARASPELAIARFCAAARTAVPVLVAALREAQRAHDVRADEAYAEACRAASAEKREAELRAEVERLTRSVSLHKLALDEERRCHDLTRAAVLDREARLSDLQARYDNNRSTMLALAASCRCDPRNLTKPDTFAPASDVAVSEIAADRDAEGTTPQAGAAPP